MYKFPSAKGFRRRTRLENAAATIEQLNNVVSVSMNVLTTYADPKNWQPTGDTRDVKNDAGLVVGVEQLQTWVGPGDGPKLATYALKRLLGIPEAKQTEEAK